MQSSCLIPGTEIPVTLAYQRVVDSPDLYTKAIKFWTRQEQIHVEIIVGDIWLSSTLGKGVRVKPLGPLKSNYVYQKLPNTHLTDAQYKIFMSWADAQNGKKYDMTGIIFSQIIPVRFDDKKKWFCSELVTKALQILGYQEVLELYPQEVTPGDLWELFNNV